MQQNENIQTQSGTCYHTAATKYYLWMITIDCICVSASNERGGENPRRISPSVGYLANLITKGDSYSQVQV